MQEEVVVIVMTAIIAGTLMVATFMRGIFKYLTSRHQPVVREAGGESLTAGELERLLREAVEDAVAPLVDKIERLEERLSAPEDRLQDAAEPRLTLDAEELVAEETPVRPRRAVR